MPHALRSETNAFSQSGPAGPVAANNHSNRPLFPPLHEVVAPLLRDAEIMAHLRGCNHCAPSIASPERPDLFPLRTVFGETAPDEMLDAPWQRATPFQRAERLKRQRARQRKVTILRRTDPLFERATHILEFLLRDMPEGKALSLLGEMDQDPHAFLRHYRNMRSMAANVEHLHHLKNLERQDELSALKRRVKNGGAREGDLLRYLQLTGFGD